MTTVWIPCPECDGYGIVERETYHRDMISAKDVPCENCGGSGEVAINDEDDLLEDDGFITVYESGRGAK